MATAKATNKGKQTPVTSIQVSGVFRADLARRAAAVREGRYRSRSHFVCEAIRQALRGGAQA